MPSLLDLVFFKEIEEGLRFANLRDWEQNPGKSLPPNAVVIGKMPEALIGLLMLYYGAFESGGDTFMKLVKEGNTYSDEQIVAYRYSWHACKIRQSSLTDCSGQLSVVSSTLTRMRTKSATPRTLWCTSCTDPSHHPKA